MERPIAYASRTLTAAERNYAQFHKELLALKSVLSKFQQFLSGRPFVAYTDHRPLVGLLKNQTPVGLCARVVRWLLTIGSYQRTLKYHPGSKNAYADMLSRLPLPVGGATGEDGDVFNHNIDGVEQWARTAPTPQLPDFTARWVTVTESGLLSASAVAEHTASDPKLSLVLQFVQNGWPKKSVPGLEKYWGKRLELHTERNCVMWGDRVVVPSIIREPALKQLHRLLHGVVRSKRLARLHIWWPNINEQIENMISSCEICQPSGRNKPASPDRAWPECRVWGRLHLEFRRVFPG